MVGSWTATSKNSFTCCKFKINYLVFGALLIRVRAGVTVLLEWVHVGQESSVVGWGAEWGA